MSGMAGESVGENKAATAYRRKASMKKNGASVIIEKERKTGSKWRGGWRGVSVGIRRRRKHKSKASKSSSIAPK